MAQLRDFLYLDIDKTRSLVAQAQEGYPDAFAKTTSQQGNASVKVLEYALERSSTETISVHHHLYSLLESYLSANKKVIRISEEGKHRRPEWTPTSFTDGGFVLATGSIRLFDYAAMSSALTSIPPIMKVVVQMQEQALKRELQSNSITRPEYEAKLTALRQTKPDTKDFAGITDVIQNLYGDALRIRLTPAMYKTGEYFAANLAREYMQRHQADIVAASGLVSAGKWHIFGLLDRFNLPDQQTDHIQMGGNLEDMMASLIDAFSAISKVTLSVSWPAVSLTPIAVYRAV